MSTPYRCLERSHATVPSRDVKVCNPEYTFWVIPYESVDSSQTPILEPTVGPSVY